MNSFPIIITFCNIIASIEAFTSPLQLSSTHYKYERGSLLLSPQQKFLHVGFQQNTSPSSQLNLIPLSEVWDISAVDDRASSSEKSGDNPIIRRSTCEPFSRLVPKLGCELLDSNGAFRASGSTTQNDVSNNYKLYLATHIDDLPPIAHLTIEVFDATAITLSSTSDWSAFEKAVAGAVFEPAIAMYNSYANAVGYIEVLSGLKRRMSRLITDANEIEVEDSSHAWLSPLVLPDGSLRETSKAPNMQSSSLEDIAAQSSLILTLARWLPNNELEVSATVELRLQPTDAKIPFSQPWLDNLERRLVRLFPFVSKGNESTKSVASAKSTPPLRPYLCNLCVSSSLRNLGIGRALCRIVEAIASQQWGYDHIYLHVDQSNDSARTLYEKEGYVDVGRRWNVLWAGGADEIGYYVKKL